MTQVLKRITTHKIFQDKVCKLPEVPYMNLGNLPLELTLKKKERKKTHFFVSVTTVPIQFAWPSRGLVL